MRGVSVETAIYVTLLVIAAVTRFWRLGVKALHHDESLHAYYSWLYATGKGYTHHPLMHGPFLFHANALVYLLIGASDATSRSMPAIFGVALVGLPYLLRGPRHLGRWGALATSFLLLVSPSILYQSRYIRHDIYTAFGTLLLFACIVRYIEKPERRWLVTGAATTAGLLANHEVIFAILAIFGLYLYGALLWSRIKALLPTRRDVAYRLVAVHGVALLAALAVVPLVRPRFKSHIFPIPWENPSMQQQRDYYANLVTDPLVIGLALVAVGFVLGLRHVLNAARDPQRRDDGWLPSLFGDAPAGTIESGIRRAWADRSGLGLALAVGGVIFVGLYTSLLSNLNGLFSSTIATNGTLLYWLGQHDYRRGEQPWFYFLLLMPQYEFVAVLCGGGMALLTCWRALGGALGRWSPGRNLFFRLFLTVWFVFIFLGLSYAGEKMPWLVVHISLPATVLAGALVGGLIERAIAARPRGSISARLPSLLGLPEWSLFGGLLLAGACWLALAGRLSNGRYVQDATRGGWRRTLTTYDARHWWLLALPPLVALLVLAASYVWRGARRTGLSALLAITVGLSLLQIHTGWRLSYYEADVPRDMLVYTQTSPDVTRMMSELTQLSYELTGGKGMEIYYDSGVSWPMEWYLRDFPNKHFFGTSLSTPPGNAPVVLVSNQYDGAVSKQLSGYTAQEYVLRWWFPEETYRDFAIAPELNPGRSAWKSADAPRGLGAIVKSIGHTIGHELTPDGQMRLYRLLMYRDLDWPNGQFNFKVYIRNDLLPQLNGLRY